MSSPFRFMVAGALLAGSFSLSVAQEGGSSPADAQERLKALVAAVKAKGAAEGAKYVMGADDPLKCKTKDIVCMLVDVNTNTMLVHSAVPKLVGTPVDDDVQDIDGNSLSKLQFGPAKAGKTKWEAKYKFARPDTRKIVPRWAFCEKADDARVACVSISS